MALATLTTSIVDPNSQAFTLKEGKNFIIEEKCQLCVSFLHINQDPKIRNGQKSNTFWDRVSKDYNKNKPICGIEQLTRSLKTKSREKVIEHDIAKYCGVTSLYLHWMDPGTLKKTPCKRHWHFTSWNIQNTQASPSLVASWCWKICPSGWICTSTWKKQCHWKVWPSQPTLMKNYVKSMHLAFN